MKRKKIYLIDKEELATLSTKILLGRLKNLLQCEDSLELSDEEDEISTAPDQIRFKNTDQWQLAYENVKAELATREHVPMGKELEAIKSARHKLQKTKDRKVNR